jgi:hypothetical protein
MKLITPLEEQTFSESVAFTVMPLNLEEAMLSRFPPCPFARSYVQQ